MIQVRKAKCADIMAIKAIEDHCFLVPWHIKSLQTFICGTKTHVCYVAVDSENRGEIVGYIAAINTGIEAEVANIAVLPSYRNKGVGGAMVSYLIHQLMDKGVDSVFLEVRPSNISAIRLYEKNLFRCCGNRKNYYQEPIEDAWIMRRKMRCASNEIDKKPSDTKQNSR